MSALKYVSTLGTGFQRTTISNGGSGYTSGATSIVVADGSVFPATGDFWVGVGDQDPPDFIKICTARTGNTLTVAAGVVAGTDGNKADGVTVQWVLPPEALDQLRSDLLPTRATMWHEDSIATVGGTMGTSLDAAHPYFAVWYQSTHANGDTFTQSFVLVAGTYTLKILGITFTNRGMIDWYLDDVSISTGQDWYTAGAAQQNITKTIGSVTVSGTGRHTLKGVVNGKNASSSDYYITLTKMAFVPAADTKSV